MLIQSDSILQEQFPLKSFNTFGMDVHARFFASFQSLDVLRHLLSLTSCREMPLLILGGGSNILFTADFQGVVLKNEIGGITVESEDEDHVYVRAGAGVSWHQLVMDTLNTGFHGLENLALIPGSVGAAPMQNIGAYGVELKDLFHSLEAIRISDGEKFHFTNEDCAFGYRDSIFKQAYKNQFIITSVLFRLYKKQHLKTHYGSIGAELADCPDSEINSMAVARAVMRIRQSKLPDPAILGNAGSFFKNPEIDLAQFEQLKNQFPDMVAYPSGTDKMKLAAGWLIEKAGWKGVRRGDAGCHDKQALVLVNHGLAKGIDVFTLSEAIIDSVHAMFGVYLHREVNVY
jgi:UDP-N-acetylmuramate dehydrogenase